MEEARRSAPGNPLTWDKACRAAGYLLLAGCGAWLLATRPWPIAPAAGDVQFLVLGIGLLGGIPAAAACLLGRFRVEYVALPLIIAGLASFTALLLARVVSSFNGLAATLLLGAFTALLLARWLALHALALEWKRAHPRTPKRAQV